MGARGIIKAMEYDWAHLAQRMIDFYVETLNKIKLPEAIPEAEIQPVSAASGKH